MSTTHIGDVCAHSTSVVKAFTWRTIATTITTVLVLWRGGGDLHLAMEVGVLDVFTKLLAYYLHERGWLKYGTRLEFLTVAYCKIKDAVKGAYIKVKDTVTGIWKKER